ncbi:MAG: xanthine dehydrogenase family protein molybdopterin-binding subunit [Betaproteobacteria bacterium]|nr:xanthine dehydrogenase family protein molybdopterin-binding subunit [Betaproteobacteria bacterium]
MDRREFLKTSGALVISFRAPSFQALAQAGGKPALVPGELDSWIAVLPNGDVQAFFGKMDMGQGLDVAVAQIVAEELDVGADRVEVLMGDTGTSCNQGGASGSTGVSNGARLMRRAAAEARRVLVERASAQLGSPATELKVADGVVTGPKGSTSYADLIGGRYFNHKVEWNNQVGNPMDIKVPAKSKAPADYKVVGKPMPRRDVAWKVYGTSKFVTDVRVPGMLHARVLRPPRAACKVKSLDAGSIKGIRGAQVIRDKDFVAVVAPREWDAVRAAKALKVEWEPMKAPFVPMKDLYQHIRNAKVVKREDEVKKGDVNAALSAPGVKVVQAEYEWPFNSHASMGPGCAVVEIEKDGSCNVWTGSQKPHFVRDGVARLLNLPPEKVRAVWVAGPGSYGRNDAGDAAMDAAFLAKATGKPVRVQGMRADGTAWDPKGPACVHRARAALDASGKVVGYEFISKGFSRQHIATNESQPADSLVGQSLGVAPNPTQIFGVPGESYGFENKLLGWETIPQFVDHCSPLRTSHLRDPVGPEIHFGSEQFIDEVAHAAGEDPVAFRLKYLTNPRHAAVVKAVAEKSGWAGLGKGKGISFADRNGTAVAAVAQVEVDRKTGRVWARKFWIAHDCGLIINPLILKQTIEGNVVQGLSRTLFEEVRFDRDSVKSVDWASYPILDMGDAPESIEIVLIDRPEVAPSGAGEPTIRVIPAAVANAFFDATGVRMRRAPLSPEYVKAALSKA